MNEKEFVEALKEKNMLLTKDQLNKFQKYYELVKEKNKEYNLTRIIKKEEVYLKHYYDSLTIVQSINLKEKLKLCDIGSGAGFPGIVLKIMFRNLDVTLVESSGKKVDFLKLVIKELDLKKIKAVNERAEDYIEKSRESFDVVTARAVAPLNILLELSAPFLKVGGTFIGMKGKKGFDELELSGNAIKILGLEIKKIGKIFLPKENSERIIISLKKIKRTDKLYPRKYSQIKKKPL